MDRRHFFKGLAVLAVIGDALMPGFAKGAAKPLLLGRVLNVAVVEELPLIYRVSADSVQSIEAVRDGGVELLITGDDATIALLRHALIAPGEARTCVAEGVVRVGADPAFTITVDATGTGMCARAVRMDELAGTVRSGSRSRDWRDQIDASGLLVHS